MKKPSKPTTPHEPKAPTRSYDETWPASFSVYDETIGSILKRVNQQMVNWRGMRSDCQFADPTVDEITIEQSHGYGDDTSVEAKWDQKVTITMTLSEWASAQAKHRKALNEYKGRFAAYEVKMAQYETDIVAYETERVRAIESRDRETLARLRAKYPKA